jgi:phosphoglycolate phosphatase-like HAD superfamily hydrolase
MDTTPLVFDLDGVIVKTNFTKHDAMLSLFDDHPDQRDSISAFILSNGGVPRIEKISRILSSHIFIEPSDSVLSYYLDQYAVRLEEQLAVAPFVEGVVEFIANYTGARYVCSSAPEKEVQNQIARLSLQHYFAAIYGGTTPKTETLRQIAAKHTNLPIAFFGDSVGDYEASCQAKVDFVGIVCERDNFGGLSVVKLKDFTSPALVEAALHRSSAQRAA